MSPAKLRKPFQGKEIVTLRDHLTLTTIKRVLNVVQFYCIPRRPKCKSLAHYFMFKLIVRRGQKSKVCVTQ